MLRACGVTNLFNINMTALPDWGLTVCQVTNFVCNNLFNPHNDTMRIIVIPILQMKEQRG